MTNEEKARELANLCNECELVDCGKGIVSCINLALYNNTIEVAQWKDEKIRRYFSEHIVPSGDYNMELADDFIRYNEEKQKAIDEIIKTINEYE